MVSGQYYVRVRGRVIGPFSEEKLRKMARSGQVGQTHEISPDAVTWRRASEYQGLLAEESEPTTADVNDGDEVTRANPSTVHQPAQPKIGKEKVWFLNQGGENLGPFTVEEVRSQITSGTVSRDALAWKEGTPDWSAVLEVFPELKQPIMQPSDSGELSNASRHTKSDDGTGNAAFIGLILMSRPWTLFLAITFITLFSLAGVGAITALVIGIAADTSSDVAEVYLTFCGMAVVTSITLLINALLLLQFSNSLGVLRFNREQRVLEQVAKDLYRFCKYTGIVVIVWLGIYLAAYLFSLVLAAKGVT
ncbi:MAG: DUF4339 domain-containing protein [Pirellulales bacterium]